jgi:hypothetical protein
MQGKEFELNHPSRIDHQESLQAIKEDYFSLKEVTFIRHTWYAARRLPICLSLRVYCHAKQSTKTGEIPSTYKSLESGWSP